MLPNFAYVRPDSIDEAVRHLSDSGAAIHAGGTDLLSCLRDRVFDVRKVVSISGLKDLSGIGNAGRGVRIGALTTITAVAESPIIREKYAALAQGAREVASPQLRHQGTIGGNICQKPRCWYYRGEFDCLRKGGELCYADGGENAFHCILGGYGCYIVHPSDTAPPLVALNATVRTAGPSGGRTIPLADFHVLPAVDPRRETVLEPAEVVTDILLPAPPAGLRSSYRKIRARRSWDFALAGVALALVMEGDTVTDGRIVLSGAAPVPWRSKEAESAVIGRSISLETAHKAAAAAMSDAEPLAQNDYKIPLFKGVIEEELLKLAAG
ncbi:MAG: xanthine dehydrogenase family protein subunit M [Desulfobacterales bacterium]